MTERSEHDDPVAEIVRLVELMKNAHAVMREHGWHLAPASIDDDSDGVLELAAAEIEDDFATVIREYEDRLRKVSE